MQESYKKYPKRFSNEKHFVNERIRSEEVRLIGAEGENLGVVPTKDAIRMAKELEKDLVLISEKAVPPVGKILEYSKFLYEERKKQSASKSKAHKSDTKEFIFGPAIGDGDLNIRIDRTREFIKDGHRVKMTVKLKGRETMHPEIGLEKIEYAVKMLSDVTKTEEDKISLKGNLITVTFVKK